MPKILKAGQEEEALREAHAELPAPGHKRREFMKERLARLQEAAQRMATEMQRGTIDPQKLEILNEIAGRVEYLDVSNARDGRVYTWVSTNRHGQHVQEMKGFGFQVVQGDDPEAKELMDSGGATTRRLGDVILMWCPEELYVALKAKKIVDQRKMEQSSAANLRELVDKNRSRGFSIRPFGMNTLEGPDIEVGRFSNKQMHDAAVKMLDGHLRDGTVPGMVVK